MLPKLFALSLALACAAPAPAPAAASRKPDWIDRESAQWPREMYVLGVGSADDRSAAEDRARADLARVFETRVSSTLSANESESSSTATGQADTHSEQISVSDETRSTTDKVLEGVEIVEIWQDPQSRQIYALAALDRQQAASRLDARMQALEENAKPLRARLSTQDKADGLAAALRLLRAERDRQAVVQDLRIVVPNRPPPSGTTETAAREFISRLSVAVAISGDQNGMVRDALVSGLTAAGFTVKPDAENPDLRGVATVSVQSLGLKDGWYWSRGNVGVALQDPASSRVVINLTSNVRDASKVATESDRRVLKKLSDKVRTDVPAAVASWADKQP
ncbi:MAG TPA: LPP20 family lipoprotein [Myxococcales bacterium]|nr:LPP20 family lipoprotein [Myxococcales bacterium]